MPLMGRVLSKLNRCGRCCQEVKAKFCSVKTLLIFCRVQSSGSSGNASNSARPTSSWALRPLLMDIKFLENSTLKFCSTNSTPILIALSIDSRVSREIALLSVMKTPFSKLVKQTIDGPNDNTCCTFGDADQQVARELMSLNLKTDF